ncbi:acyl transferase/acyl hydrolase/lysophospholipase [Trichophaea hybrida]|nr:acyl transferase/acyl hydrolase/lysophospholipase [Trichophaea hybrida]
MTELLSNVKNCEQCTRGSVDGALTLYWCNACDEVMCDECWDTQPAHKKTKNRTKVQLHERTKLEIADLINSILGEDRETEQQLLEDSTNQFPSLISFVGETGVKKSTLINALIKSNISSCRTDESHIVPVMGLETGTPISGDVHLFSDPDTLALAQSYIATAKGLMEAIIQPGDRFPRSLRASNPRDVPVSRAESVSPMVVNNLYPTILFPFSDVICFVTKSIKKIEHHVGNLISWAEKAFDRSLNQPMLPYVIIVVNVLEPDQKATNFADGYGVLVNPPSLITGQYRKLYQAIKKASENAEEKRKSVDLLMTSEELDRYFELALAHFSETPNKPFNFLNSVLTNNPINPTFKDHVLNLLVYMMRNFPTQTEAMILQKSAPLVASCIFLDIFRQRYPYRGNSNEAKDGYIELSAKAESEFHQKHWRYEVKDSQGMRCANVAPGHQKGHQTSDGKIFAAGGYVSSFDCQKGGFKKQISSTLDRLFKTQKMGTDKAEETKFAAYLHAWDGGIRSIMQLTILELLEECIGLSIPIQEFFDLIIGTSGGGIVAFGLGLKQLDVKTCNAQFQELSRKAFNSRKGSSVPIWGLIVEARHHGKYETRGLEEALKKIFGNGPIFGTNQNCEKRLPTKVGVTTTSSNHHTYLLANYNRQTIEQSRFYSFFRAANYLEELKIWEAFRATSAAPTYFMSFFHGTSRHTFTDGGIKYNNPVNVADMERKKLWPHLAGSDPDILLSIGTGFEQYAANNRDRPGPKNQAGFRGFAMGLIRLASDTIQDGMDNEKLWEKFLSGVASSTMDDHDKLRKCRRLNAEFQDVPKLDQVERMAELQDRTRRTFKDSLDT